MAPHITIPNQADGRVPCWDKIIHPGKKPSGNVLRPRPSPSPAESRKFYVSLGKSDFVEIISGLGTNWKAPEFLICHLSGYFQKKCALAADAGTAKVFTGPPSKPNVFSDFIIWIHAGMRADIITPSIETWQLGEDLEAPEFSNQVMELLQDKLSETDEGSSSEWIDPHPAFEKELLSYLATKLDSPQPKLQDFDLHPMLRFTFDCLAWKAAHKRDQSIKLFWNKMVLNGKEFGLHLVKQTRDYDRDQALLPPWAKENGAKYMIQIFEEEKGSN